MHSSDRIDAAQSPAPGAVAYDLAQSSVETPTEPDLGEPRYAIELVLPDGGLVGLVLPRQCQTEMVRRIALCPIPNSPRWFIGMMNLRGSLVPVFDLVASLFADAPLASARVVLVTGTGESAFAFPIPSEPQLVHLRELEAAPAGVSPEMQPFVVGSYRLDQALWLEFQFDQWIAQRFTGAVRGREVRRVSLQGT